MRRYEVLLPLHYNDGTKILPNLHFKTVEEVVEQFSGISLEDGGVSGLWKNDNDETITDKLVRFYVDVEDTVENVQWFVEQKVVWEARFNRNNIYIVSYQVSVLDPHKLGE